MVKTRMEPSEGARERVLRVGLDLFSSKGFEGSGLREVATAAEEICCSTAEQEKSAERDPVGGDDPLEIRFREVELLADRGQRDIDNREVDDCHEERDGQDGEGAPAVNLTGARRSHSSCVR